MKYEITTVLLWAIALAAMAFTDSSANVVGPVFAICMIGSVFVVRLARRDKEGS